jgi:hypothetical protein
MKTPLLVVLALAAILGAALFGSSRLAAALDQQYQP